MYRNGHFYAPKLFTMLSRNCHRKTLMCRKRPPRTEIVQDCFLTQHVQEPTRQSNILDLVLTTEI